MTNREMAELVAKFRTPPGLNWEPLANDIETLLNAKDRPTQERGADVDENTKISED